MRRRLFHFASTASLVVFCVATLVIGGMGIWGDRSHRFLQLFGPWECSAGFTRMGVQIVVLHVWASPVVGPVAAATRPTPPQYFTFQNQFPHYFWWRGPFGSEYGPLVAIRGNRVQAMGTRTWVMFPFRLFAAVLLLMPRVRLIVIPVVRRVRWARRRGGCGRCGYDLTGNTSGVCSECGVAIE